MPFFGDREVWMSLIPLGHIGQKHRFSVIIVEIKCLNDSKKLKKEIKI
jgi:hypothetical protein